MKKIQEGDTIPAFSLPDQDGKLTHIEDFIGKRNLVLFFYPKDDTPGCAKEACTFRDQFESFSGLDAEVIGISGQSVESHKRFAQKYGLLYPLLSDEGNKIRRLFGVETDFFGLLPGRVTYVADKSGKIIKIFNSQFQVTRHVEKSLQALRHPTV